MGSLTVKPLRIGYQPLSPDLSQPGDRRRVVFWAKHRGHTITTDLSEPVDVYLLSEKADFGLFPKKAAGAPVVFDLVDAYLAKDNLAKDWLRGVSKIATGQLTGWPKPFTKFVENLCIGSSAVICSSPEQKETILPYAKNVHVILDSHAELPLVPFSNKGKAVHKQLLWEGLPATIGGLDQIASALTSTNEKFEMELNCVTNTDYFKFLGKYFHGNTSSLLKRTLGSSYQYSRITPWNIENLVAAARMASCAVIPIDLTDSLQNLKPENRLLIMWRLGLPCLTSPSPAYIRTSETAGSDTICFTGEDWKRKMTGILENPELAEDIVKKGQRYLQEFHNTDLLLEKWDRVFNSVI